MLNNNHQTQFILIITINIIHVLFYPFKFYTIKNSKVCRLNLPLPSAIMMFLFKYCQKEVLFEVGSKKRNIIIAIMVAMFLGAVEGTVVTTAIPTIVKDLKGFESLSWVFSMYLLTSAIATPIYGKLCDLYGRKNVFCIGIIIFLAGSTLCGLSHSINQLIAFRAIQGLGAGSIFTITYTIVGDVFSLSERAKVQGWLGSVWGIASLVGPFLGGFFIHTLSWHWIFFINIPFGIMSIILLQKNLTEKFEKRKHSIDFAGIVLLSGAISLILYGTLTISKGESKNLAVSAFIILGAISLFTGFYFVEKRAKEPILPFDIFTKSSIIVNVISFLVPVLLIGISVYMPVYTQNVLGFSAIISGLLMVPMTVGWVLSSVLLSKAITKYGERTVVGSSTLILLIGSILLTTLSIQSSVVILIAFVFIIGVGFGSTLTTLTILVQTSVLPNKRGIAVASNSLVRTLGQTIGVSVLGSIFNITVIRYFSSKGINNIDVNDLNTISSVKDEFLQENIKLAMNHSLHTLFIIFIITAGLCLLLSTRLSKKLMEEKQEGKLDGAAEA